MENNISVYYTEVNNKDNNEPSPAPDRNEFNRRLHKIVKNTSNTRIITQEMYKCFIEHVKRIRLHGKTHAIDYKREKKYALLKLPNGEERLFYKPALVKNTRLLMVTLEEVYDIVHNYHVNLTNHGGRSRMITELQKKYYNVTTECVMIYLSMCRKCKERRNLRELQLANRNKNKIVNEQETVQNSNDDNSNDVCEPSNEVVRSLDPGGSIVFEMEKDEVISESAQKYPELYSRGQMDLLSVTNESNEEYKFLMVYRNYATKFIHLKAMAGISVDEAAEALLDIFLVFGAPNILQSKNGAAILKPICNRIMNLCPDMRVVYSDNIFPCSTFHGKSNEDILKKLNAWLVMTQNTKWQKGVKYIQHSLNTTFHETICRTPNELVFGSNPSKGVSFLSNTENVFSESDLLTVLDSKNEQNSNLQNSLILTESLLLPNDLFKVEVESLSESDEENVE